MNNQPGSNRRCFLDIETSTDSDSEFAQGPIKNQQSHQQSLKRSQKVEREESECDKENGPVKKKRGKYESNIVSRHRYTIQDKEEMVGYLVESSILRANETATWYLLSSSDRLAHHRTSQSLARYFKTKLHQKAHTYTNNEKAKLLFKRVSEKINTEASQKKMRVTRN